MTTQAALFAQQHYVILPGAISKEVCEVLSDYARIKAAQSPRRKKGDALTGVHREYGDPLMETFLDKLTPAVEAATGLALWPALSFYYTYEHGHRLTPHKDRSSCEIVAGLCIGADEAFKREAGSWPLIINSNGQAVPIALNDGDLVIFRGHDLEHWRDTFTGTWFVSAIFAYVDKNGPYAFQRYDQRTQIGAPHVGMFRWTYGCVKQWVKSVLR